MAQSIDLKAAGRAGVGKGAARAVRREGRVPGVIYGDQQKAEAITLDHKEIMLAYQRGRFLSTVVNLDVDGKKSRVIPRDIQLDPVRDFPLHVDFLRLGKDATIRVRIPVRFVDQDKSPGLKRGGVLNVVRYDIEFIAPVDAIPNEVTASLDGMDIGHSLHISAIKLPEGVKPTILNRDFTVATIAGVKAEEEVKPAEEAVVEGEGAVAVDGEAPADGQATAKGDAAAKGGDKGADKAPEKGGKK